MRLAPARRLAPALLLVPLLAAPSARAASPSEKQTFERTHTFVGDKDVKVGLKHGDVTIDSVRIRNWPDADDLAKGEKDLNDTHTMVVEFTYSNRNESSDYKCKYTIVIPDPKGGKPLGENDRTATLDKGKMGDTNKVFVKMKTRLYRTVKSYKVTYEIWKK